MSGPSWRGKLAAFGGVEVGHAGAKVAVARAGETGQSAQS